MASKFDKFKDLGDQALKKGEYDQALRYFDRAVFIEQKNSSGWSRKAAAEIYLQKYDDALKSVNEAIRLDRKNADAWFNRGLIRDKRRNYDDAIKDYDHALSYSPKHVKALNNKGTIMGQLERWEEAEKCFKKVLELDPKNQDAKENLSLLADYKVGKHKRRCFIATAAYGSPFDTRINILRSWRDNILIRTNIGVLFINIYYKISPPIANIIARSKMLKAIVRRGLDPVISYISKKHKF